MAKTMVALRSRQKKGSKPLTLKDLTVSREVRNAKVVTLTGDQIAAILGGTQHIHDVTEPSAFVDPYVMHFELVGMADTLEALGDEMDGKPFEGAMHYLAGQLKQMAHRVCALDRAATPAATFVVEVKK